jgi:hypothetical protein
MFIFLKDTVMIRRLLAVTIIGCTVALAQNANLGTAGAQFLQIPIGARPVALGGAYVALANDASALFWNPAGIMNVGGTALHFSHTPWWATVRLNAAAFAMNLGEAGTIGVSTIVLGMDKMEVTTEYQPDGTGEMFDAQDLMIGVTYARALTERFNAGMTAKYIQQRIWNETASAVAIDLGTQYRLWFNNFTIGMSLTNFGGDLRLDGRDLTYKYDIDDRVPNNRLLPIKLDTEEYPLPLHFQLGVCADLYRSHDFVWQVAADVTHPNDNAERVNIGTEVAFFDRIFLRGGYRHNYDDENLTLGFGLALPLETAKLLFDYSYSNYDLLPSIQRFSLGIDF